LRIRCATAIIGALRTGRRLDHQPSSTAESRGGVSILELWCNLGVVQIDSRSAQIRLSPFGLMEDIMAKKAKKAKKTVKKAAKKTAKKKTAKKKK
jgi:hypothetical protein